MIDPLPHSFVAAVLAAMLSAKKLGAQGKSEGTFACTFCTSGTIRYSVASNGHSRGSCSHEGCVQWIE